MKMNKEQVLELVESLPDDGEFQMNTGYDHRAIFKRATFVMAFFYLFYIPLSILMNTDIIIVLATVLNAPLFFIAGSYR